MSWVTDKAKSSSSLYSKKRKYEQNQLLTPNYNTISFEEYIQQKYQEITIQSEKEKKEWEEKIHILQNEEKKLEHTDPGNRGLIRKRKQISKAIEESKEKLKQLLNNPRIEEFKKAILPFTEAHERELQLMAVDKLKFSHNHSYNHNQNHNHHNHNHSYTSHFVVPSGVSSLDPHSIQSSVMKECIQELEKVPVEIKVMPQEVCEDCDSVMGLESRSSTLICAYCGAWKPYLDATSSHMAYGEEVEFTAFAYLRLNHFNERLTYSQAKESTRIDANDLKKVMDRLIEKRIYDPEKITMETTYLVAKELKMRHVYKQNTQLWCRITGKPPPRMTPEQEEQLRSMFKAVNRMWEKYKPEERKNFLSYNYCLYKFCELLGLPHKNLFKLLKGDKKLEKQDEIFKKICEDPELDWEFVPSKNE